MGIEIKQGEDREEEGRRNRKSRSQWSRMQSREQEAYLTSHSGSQAIQK